MRIPEKSQYPKKLHLRGETYEIIFVKNLRCLGETDSTKKIIRIKAGLSKNETFRTFIHEVLHFLEMEWPVKLKHKTVYVLEEALFHLFIDNFL